MDEGDTLPEARVHGGCSAVGKALGGRVLEDRVQMPSSALISFCEVCETWASHWPALQLSLHKKKGWRPALGSPLHAIKAHA